MRAEAFTTALFCSRNAVIVIANVDAEVVSVILHLGALWLRWPIYGSTHNIILVLTSAQYTLEPALRIPLLYKRPSNTSSLGLAFVTAHLCIRNKNGIVMNVQAKTVPAWLQITRIHQAADTARGSNPSTNHCCGAFVALSFFV